MEKYLEVLNDIYWVSNANLGFTPFKLVVSDSICRDIQTELFGPSNSQYVFFNSAFIYSSMFIESDPIMPKSNFAIIHEDPTRPRKYHTLITTGNFIDLVNEVTEYYPDSTGTTFFRPVQKIAQPITPLPPPPQPGQWNPYGHLHAALKPPIPGYGNAASIKTNYLDDKVPVELEKTPCTHTWANYNGLIESYRYCTKCDTKDKS